MASQEADGMQAHRIDALTVDAIQDLVSIDHALGDFDSRPCVVDLISSVDRVAMHGCLQTFVAMDKAQFLLKCGNPALTMLMKSSGIAGSAHVRDTRPWFGVPVAQSP